MKRLNKQQEDLLERVFSGEVGPDDEGNVLRACEDPVFKEELRQRTALRRALRQQKEASPVRKELKDIRHRVYQRQAAIRRRTFITSAAAVALILIMVGIPKSRDAILNLFRGGESSPLTMAELVALPRDMANASQGVDVGEGPYKEGKLKFGKKQYPEAIADLEKVSTDSKYYQVSRFLLAHCYLITGKNIPIAVQIFEKFLALNADEILQGEYVLDPEKLRWNLTLAYRSNNQMNLYRKELQAFADDPISPYQEKAKELLKIDF